MAPPLLEPQKPLLWPPMMTTTKATATTKEELQAKEVSCFKAVTSHCHNVYYVPVSNCCTGTGAQTLFKTDKNQVAAAAEATVRNTSVVW